MSDQDLGGSESELIADEPDSLPLDDVEADETAETEPARQGVSGPLDYSWTSSHYAYRPPGAKGK